MSDNDCEKHVKRIQKYDFKMCAELMVGVMLVYQNVIYYKLSIQEGWVCTVCTSVEYYLWFGGSSLSYVTISLI